MSVSFEEIGQTVATFQLESGLAVGQVCKITATGKAGACSKGDDFCGVVLAKNGDYGAVAVRGFVTLPYSGETAPAVGYCALAADGDGAVAKASTGGRSLLAVSVESGTVTVLL